MGSDVNRRQFIGAALAAGPLAMAMAMRPAGAAGAKPPVCVFSKHLQFLDYKQLAATCKALGLDGVDLTVREGGHVLPENLDRDLPAAVEAIRAEGLEVPMITTRLKSGDDAGAREIFEAAAKLGIRYVRIGGHKYNALGEIPPQIEGFTAEVRALTQLAESFDLTLGYHNHSGLMNFGAPVWDLERMYAAIGSKHLGSNFDLGHAMVEGGFGDWQITSRLMAPLTKMMAVKDFVWGERSTPRWVPLGEGVVPFVEMLRIFQRAGFQGPISMHFEYRIPSDDAMIEEVRKAALTLRDFIEKAGYG